VGKNSSGDLREMDKNAAYKDELINKNVDTRLMPIREIYNKRELK
jgi:hypothetical protein